MTRTFHLSIVTPEKVFYEGDIVSLTVPGSEGYLGVLTNHAPLITAVVPGRVEFRDGDGKAYHLAASGGYFEISENEATLLADAIETAEEIDIERARAAWDRATKELKAVQQGNSDIDEAAARAALARAVNRIRVYEGRD